MLIIEAKLENQLAFLPFNQLKFQFPSRTKLKAGQFLSSLLALPFNLSFR